MTSPAAARPVARRRAAVPAVHRLSRNVLVIATFLALAATLGPAWVVRLGVLVAVAAAFVVCAVTWRELSEARRSHSLQLLAASQAHGLTLGQERRANALVVQTLAERSRQAVGEAGKLQVIVVSLGERLAAATAQNAFLHSELRHRDQVISELRGTVRSRDAELVALHKHTVHEGTLHDDTVQDEISADQAPGERGRRAASYPEVRALPRRALTDPRPMTTLRDELSAAESRRPLLDLGPSSPMVLPNYEEDRKLA